jgi:glycosyltransferase involved in cell wall biosynthesis
MKVLMFGWEFPPFKSGGLGTACYGLTRALSKNDVKVTFVIPKAPYDIKAEFVDLLVAKNVEIEQSQEQSRQECDPNIEIKTINSIITPYMTFAEYDFELSKVNREKLKKMIRIKSSTTNSKDEAVYGENLGLEVMQYTQKAKLIAAMTDFDVINCHDWMTYRAGIEAKKMSGKPLVAHVHATEFDRCAYGVNQQVYEMERDGFENADLIIANSHLTKRNVVEHYGIEPEKVKVVHLGIEQNEKEYTTQISKSKKSFDKTVLFLGRVTYQKGPDYFLKAAKEVLKFEPDTKFVIAGDGDMLPNTIKMACDLGISKNVSFTGFLKGKDVHKAFQMADVYVMPSVSEPFGLTPLESVKNGTPTIISNQSGISEVFNNTLKCDFWDVNQLTNKIVNVLRYNALRNELVHNAKEEVRQMDWETPAIKSKHVFKEAIERFSN